MLIRAVWDIRCVRISYHSRFKWEQPEKIQGLFEKSFSKR